MAEAQGQAETQPAGDLNPHEAVAYLAEAIEKADAAESKPRDTQGKFAKAAPEAAQEETQAEEETETTDEAASTEETQEEAQAEEPRKLKLKYNGEDKEFLEPEVIELAQKGYDYTQKSMALAKERTEIGAKLKADQEAVRKQYETQLQVYQQLALKMADQEALTADLAKVAMDDPAKALQLSLKRQAISETITAIQAEQQKVAQQRQAEYQEAVQKQASTAVEKLRERIPGWNNDLYGKVLKAAVESYGYTQNEVNAITDHRAIEVLNDAMKYRESQATKPKIVDKRIAAVPKVTKPGSSEKPDAKGAKLKDGMARLEKSGRREDAQDYVLQLMANGKL